MTSQDFLEDLGKFVRSRPREFQNTPHAWHSRLSAVLTTVLDESLATRTVISKLKIILLRNGRWVSADSTSLLFPNKSGLLVIPKGIKVGEVHPDVNKDHHRRTLLKRLGARPFEARRICEIILETHKKPEFCSQKHSVEDLVAYMEFMYKANWTNRGTDDFWFASKGGSYALGSKMYINSELPSSVTKYFVNHRTTFLFLYQDYSRIRNEE